MIENVDQRSKDYSDIKDKYRPGHADFTYDVKYGMRDYRGGGRASARETAARVAAGAVARKIVPGMSVRGALVQMGPHKIDRARWDWAEVERNPFFCPDAQTAEFFDDYLDGVRKAGSSVGAVIEVVAEGVPAGLGAPVYGKLDGDIAAALMGINAVKGVEIGDGFARGGAERRGKRRRDAHGQRRQAASSCRTTPAAFSAAFRPASRSSRASPSSRPRRSSPRAAPSTATAARPRSPPRAGTTPASASAPCRSARRWWHACSPTTICAIAARWAKVRRGHSRRRAS